MQETTARRVAKALIDTTEHRKGLPFSNELFYWLRQAGNIIPTRPYHFLTDKYTHYTLEDTPTGVRLTTTSTRPEVLATVAEVNEYLEHNSR